MMYRAVVVTAPSLFVGRVCPLRRVGQSDTPAQLANQTGVRVGQLYRVRRCLAVALYESSGRFGVAGGETAERVRQCLNVWVDPLTRCARRLVRGRFGWGCARLCHWGSPSRD